MSLKKPARDTGPQSGPTTCLRAHFWPLAIAGVFFLGGCPTDPGSPPTVDTSPGKTPTTTPTTTPTLTPGRSTEDVPPTTSGTLAGAQLRVVAKDAGGAVLSGAQVSVFGPGLAYGVTGATGDVVLGPLPLGTYELRVAAAGKVPVAKQFSLNVVRQRFTQESSLAAAARTIAGKVLDAQGNPLAGARVALGTAWAMTGPDGAYTLAAGPNGDATVRKTGFEPGTTSGGEVTVAPSLNKISFENGAFGTGAATAFATLRSELARLGWTVADGDSNAQVRVWTAPGSITADQAADAASFVNGGGKLVVLGDWAGASQYSPEAANKLLLPLGAQIDANLVRVPSSTLGRSEWFVPNLAADTPAGAGTVQLLGASTIQAAAPAVRFMTVPADGYRIQSAGDPGAVGVTRQIGSGLVIALGDASAWLDPEIGRSDNLSFIRSVLLW